MVGIIVIVAILVQWPIVNIICWSMMFMDENHPFNIRILMGPWPYNRWLVDNDYPSIF